MNLSDISIKRYLQQLLANVSLIAQNGIKSQDIAIYQLQTHQNIIYRCAIALQLAPLLKTTPEAIAQQIWTELSNIEQINNSEITLSFQVRLIDDKWLDWQICDRAIATYLDFLLSHQGINVSRKDAKTQTPAFLGGVKGDQTDNWLLITDNCFQYAHARCCARLRLAVQEKIISVNTLDFNQDIWYIEKPKVIPWLTESSQLRCINPSEKQLIAQFLTILDLGKESKTNHYSQAAINLSKYILEFEQKCRIWGEIKRENPNLALVRIGLYAIAQKTLCHLIQDQMGFVAILEL